MRHMSNMIDEEISLFHEEADDFDLFGDFDLDTDEETDDSDYIIDPELIQASVAEFHKLFSEQDGDLSIGSGAMLIYQHLQAAGYKTTIGIEDTKAKVSASSRNTALKDALIERVEDLLDDMVFVAHDWRCEKFTVHSVLTHTSNNELTVTINFRAV